MTTIAETGLRDMAEMIERIKASLDRHGYDNHHAHKFLQASGLSLSFTADDGFNSKALWSDPDVPSLRLQISETLAWDDDFAEVEQKIHSAIMRQPSRIDREKTHMAWVLSQQMERLGKYSGEAREAFQSAFRKSMEDAGLMALVDGRAA
jgi:hypothetical protein